MNKQQLVEVLLCKPSCEADAACVGLAWAPRGTARGPPAEGGHTQGGEYLLCTGGTLATLVDDACRWFPLTV